MITRNATINLDAIEHNFNIAAKLAPQSKVIAIIKSDAYGHGLIPVAKKLPGAEAFGVSVIEEALELRANNISQKIILLTGANTIEEIELCAQHDIDVVVHHRLHLELLSKQKTNRLISVWLKIDVGMHRLGFDGDEITEVFEQINQIKTVRKPIYLMSHLPNADRMNDPTTEEQIHIFRDHVEKFKVEASLAKSAGLLAWNQSHFNWVRPGVMLYGASPLVGKIGADHDLIPAMNFQAKIVSVRRLKAGDAVGYGGHWRCPEDMIVGIAGVGYSDGYPRHARSGTPIMVNNNICQLVGRVCMDMLAIDCRQTPDVKIGDNVLLWGEQLPIETVARHANTISYELMCHVSSRVKTIL